MLKYRLFHVGYGGMLYDSFRCGVTEYKVEWDTLDEAIGILSGWRAIGELRTDLVFVILPVFK